MTEPADDKLEAFLAEARRRVEAAGPIPVPVLNELKLLLLAQHRELNATDGLASFAITTIGIEWRTRWLLPVVLETIAQQCEERSRFGQAIGTSLRHAAAGLRSGDWDLQSAHSMTSAPVDDVHGFGIAQMSTVADEFALDRNGRLVCASLLAIASRVIDLAAVGLELAAIAWARVLGVSDPMIILVGLGFSQNNAAEAARSAMFDAPSDQIELAEAPIFTPLLNDWLVHNDTD